MPSPEQIKKLRDLTGVSIAACRSALEEAGDDEEKAISILKKKSQGLADKKAGRTLGAGVVSSYIHSGDTIGSMVVLSCETDFVAKNEEFKKLARDIAMQVAATDPDDIKTLMESPSIKDGNTTIGGLIDQAVQKFGEKTEITNFIRFQI